MPPVPSPILQPLILPHPDLSLLNPFSLAHRPRPLPCPRPALDGAPRGGEGQVQGGIDEDPHQWPRGGARLGSRLLGTVPASSAHHRARASPSTAAGHAHAATHARRAIQSSRIRRRPTPAALLRSCPNV
eukprot:scaffold85187_cov45-Phaeocystis_antarctica.AAC.2